MRRAILIILALVTFAAATAQENQIRKKYRNLSFATQTLSMPDFAEFNIKSKYGAAFTTGRTYFVHKQPLAGMIRLGIDATWFDISYAHYSQDLSETYEGIEEKFTMKLHQAEIGMQVGPSISVNPVGKLNAHLYFRFAPSFSAIYDTESEAAVGNYASFFVTGGSISYGVIGLGVESRWGNASYKNLFGGDDEGDNEGDSSPNPLKYKTSGTRIYVSFRF